MTSRQFDQTSDPVLGVHRNTSIELHSQSARVHNFLIVEHGPFFAEALDWIRHSLRAWITIEAYDAIVSHIDCVDRARCIDDDCATLHVQYVDRSVMNHCHSTSLALSQCCDVAGDAQRSTRFDNRCQNRATTAGESCVRTLVRRIGLIDDSKGGRVSFVECEAYISRGEIEDA